MLHQVVRRLVLLTATPALLFAATEPAQAGVPVPPAPPTASISPAAAASRVTTVPPVPPAAESAIAPKALMSQVVTMTNQQRAANGCTRLLTVDHDLTLSGLASVRQSVYMARTGLFSHVWRDGTTFVRRSHLAGYEQPSGENIAWGYTTANEVIKAWMASPRHRANMLNCGAKSIGTGVVYAANGVPYYTQVFGWD